MNENNTYQRALKAWGKDAQMLQVIEEMSELMKEILKNINRHKNNLDKIIEETADIEIMLEQLKYCYNIHQKVDDYKKAKLIKIDQRLDDWENTK